MRYNRAEFLEKITQLTFERLPIMCIFLIFHCPACDWACWILIPWSCAKGIKNSRIFSLFFFEEKVKLKWKGWTMAVNSIQKPILSCRSIAVWLQKTSLTKQTKTKNSPTEGSLICPWLTHLNETCFYDQSQQLVLTTELTLNVFWSWKCSSSSSITITWGANYQC